MFYLEKKSHISPSAFDNWYNGRGSFVRSYFIGDKSPETASMKAGKQIHALIEGGLLKVNHRYENPETVLAVAIFPDETTQVVEVREDGTYDVPEGAKIVVYGVPDSYGKQQGDCAAFVDYKSGKENRWDKAKLATDLKMKLTAWLVWKATGVAGSVYGSIEYLPTVWNPVERIIELTGGDSEIAAEYVYEPQDLHDLTATILKTVDEVNEAYEEWLGSTDEFINQDDITRYAELTDVVKKADAELELLKERIADQLEFGKKESVKTPFGSFYFTSKRKWVYPETLPVNLGEGKTITLAEAEEISANASASKKKFETETPPATVTKSLAFRAGRGEKK